MLERPGNPRAALGPHCLSWFQKSPPMGWGGSSLPNSLIDSDLTILIKGPKSFLGLISPPPLLS